MDVVFFLKQLYFLTQFSMQHPRDCSINIHSHLARIYSIILWQRPCCHSNIHLQIRDIKNPFELLYSAFAQQLFKYWNHFFFNLISIFYFLNNKKEQIWFFPPVFVRYSHNLGQCKSSEVLLQSEQCCKWRPAPQSTKAVMSSQGSVVTSRTILNHLCMLIYGLQILLLGSITKQ